MGRTKIVKEIEEIEALGQEDDKKAVKAVKEIVSKEVKKEQEKEDRLLGILHSSNSFIRSYFDLLRDLLDGFCGMVKLPNGYDYRVINDSVGISLIIKTPIGYFTRGFKPCHMEKYDLNAVHSIARDFDDTIDKVRTRKQSS